MLKFRTALILASIVLGAAPAAAIYPKGCMLNPGGPQCPSTLTGSPSAQNL